VNCAIGAAAFPVNAVVGGYFVLLGAMLGVLAALIPGLLNERRKLLKARTHMIELLRIEIVVALARCSNDLSDIDNILQSSKNEDARIKVLHFAPLRSICQQQALTNGEFIRETKTQDLECLSDTYDAIAAANASIERFALFTETGRQSQTFVMNVRDLYTVLREQFAEVKKKAQLEAERLTTLSPAAEKAFRWSDFAVKALGWSSLILLLAFLMIVAVALIFFRGQPLVD